MTAKQRTVGPRDGKVAYVEVVLCDGKVAQVVLRDGKAAHSGGSGFFFGVGIWLVMTFNYPVLWVRVKGQGFG